MLLRKKEEIEAWLNKYNIHNYELIENAEYGYVVNVNEEKNYVDISYNNLTNIKVKFNEVQGDFYCNGNQLESLEGCPNIVYGEFSCNHNKLESLKYSPEIINGNFFSMNNDLNLESLKYLPKQIKGRIYLNNNKNLNYLQEISDFEDLKEQVNIYFEKENLLTLINNKEIKNKVNKI